MDIINYNIGIPFTLFKATGEDGCGKNFLYV
jgi:hypothetical protein